MHNAAIIVMLSAMFLFGCSQTKPRPSSSSPESLTKADGEEKNPMVEQVRMPSWINRSDEECTPVEICALGEGTGRNLAIADAQRELAEFFESKVSSKTEVSTTVVRGDVSEEVNDEIKVVTENVVLKGLEVKRYFDNEQKYFVFATLNKNKVAGLLKAEMEALDEKNMAMLKTKRRIHYRKMMKNYELRERLNNYYQTVKNARYPKYITFDQIFALKNVPIENAPTMLVTVDGNLVVGQKKIQDLIASALSESGLPVETDTNRPHKVKIESSIDQQNMYLNVEGFQKYKFILALKSFRVEGEKKALGVLALESIQTARSLNQAYEQAMVEFEKLLIEDNKLAELEIGL